MLRGRFRRRSCEALLQDCGPLGDSSAHTPVESECTSDRKSIFGRRKAGVVDGRPQIGEIFIESSAAVGVETPKFTVGTFRHPRK